MPGSIKSAIGITLAILGSIAWQKIPELRSLSLQLSALLFLAYLGLRARTAKKLHHFLPGKNTYEFPLVVVFTLCIVGGTGGVQSPLLPLIYILGFAAVLTLETVGLATLAVGLPVWLWTQFSTTPSSQDVTHLFLLLGMAPILLAVQAQHQELRVQRQQETQDAERLQQTTLFFTTFLLPKLQLLQEMAEQPAENQESLLRQLQLLSEEVQALTKTLN